MLKSLLVSMELTQAGRAHSCRYNKAHRIQMGEPRLTIKVDRSEQHYCLSCAETFAAASLQKLLALSEQIKAGL
ncbi:hypothetical protein D9M68_382320 [compost metagenome]